MEDKVNLDQYGDVLYREDVWELGIFSNRTVAKEVFAAGLGPKSTIENFELFYKKSDVVKWIKEESLIEAVRLALKAIEESYLLSKLSIRADKRADELCNIAYTDLLRIRESDGR